MPKPRNPEYTYLPDGRGVLKAHTWIVCENCKEPCLARVDGLKRFCSKSCAVTRQHIDGQSRQASGEEHYAWKGDEAGYQAMHMRVMRTRGRADHCERREAANCVSTTYEWAHLHDTDPGDPQKYIQLCKTCHQSYDRQTGADHASAKLTAEQVADIRRRYAAGGITQQALGNEYGVTQAHVSRVILGRVHH